MTTAYRMPCAQRTYIAEVERHAREMERRRQDAEDRAVVRAMMSPWHRLPASTGRIARVVGVVALATPFVVTLCTALFSRDWGELAPGLAAATGLVLGVVAVVLGMLGVLRQPYERTASVIAIVCGLVAIPLSLWLALIVALATIQC
jgi:multisubunit Na+/H+ antiporter MnhB subunit